MSDIKFSLKIVIVLFLINVVFYLLNSSNHGHDGAKIKLDIYIKNSIQENNIDSFCVKVANQLKDKKILFLGEQQHGDGESIYLKSKLINLLSKNHGFKTVLFEGSFFYNNQLKTKIKNAQSITEEDLTKALYDFWGRSKEMGSLRKQMLRGEIDFYGFDYNFIVNGYLKDVSAYIYNYFSSFTGFSKADYKELFETFDYKNGPLVLFNYKPRKPNQDICLKQINELKMFITDKSSQSSDDKKMLIMLETLFDFYYSRTKIKPLSQNKHRDSVMFNNINKILKDFEKENSKIIIWSANSHLMYKNYDPSYSSMGELLKEKYDKKIYSVLFTSGTGETLNIATKKNMMINSTSLESVEFKLKLQNKSYIFSNFTNVRNTKDKMKFIGHQNIRNYWQYAMDSYIYIDKMKPVTF